MPKSIDHARPLDEEGMSSNEPCVDDPERPAQKPARLDEAGGRSLLDRILNAPHLERVVPQLQPDLLHRIIQHCGLEDCGEIVALATPEQLAHIFDLDLWSAARPGADEQFDADRFGLWIEVLLESGSAVAAARILAKMDAGLVVAGLAQHMRVYDRAAITPYETLDGEQVEALRGVADGLTAELGGYVLAARRTDSWDALVEVLMALGTEHPACFDQVMRACRRLSNAGYEIDGLDDLLAEGRQAMFDQGAAREQRREKQGFLPPAQARAFLQMARELRVESQDRPPANPLARAYFRAIDERTEPAPRSETGQLTAGSDTPPVSADTEKAVAAVHDVLLEAGVLPQAPRALLGGAEEHAPRLSRLQACLRFALDMAPAAYSARNEELAYLANALMAGCAIQARPFTPREASEAARAVCNLGLENWPRHWLPAGAPAQSDAFLVDHDLIGVFQVGWAILHRDVGLYAADRLIEVLTHLQCDDRDIQRGLDALRIEVKKHRRADMPWRARDALNVLAMLDLPAWAGLLALLDECPVLHAVVGAAQQPGTLSVSATDFEYISENRHIVSVHAFLRALPDALSR